MQYIQSSRKKLQQQQQHPPKDTLSMKTFHKPMLQSLNNDLDKQQYSRSNSNSDSKQATRPSLELHSEINCRIDMVFPTLFAVGCCRHCFCCCCCCCSHCCCHCCVDVAAADMPLQNMQPPSPTSCRSESSVCVIDIVFFVVAVDCCTCCSYGEVHVVMPLIVVVWSYSILYR